MRDWTDEEIRAMADRLRQSRIAAGFSRAIEAVRKFGWNYSRYMNYENGGRAIPPKQALMFADAYNISVDYIYFGDQQKLNKDQTFSSIIPHSIRRIPVVTLNDVTELTRISDGLNPMLTASVPISSDEALPDKAIFIEVSDRSMSNSSEPVSFEIGDQTLIDLAGKPKPGDFVLALVPEEQSVFLRLYREIRREDDGTLIYDLVPLNPNFRTIRASHHDGVKIIGVCKRVYRIQNL